MNDVRVVISMMLCAKMLLLQRMMEEDQGWISSAPLDVEYCNNIIEQSTNSHSSKHNSSDLGLNLGWPDSGPPV